MEDVLMLDLTQALFPRRGIVRRLFQIPTTGSTGRASEKSDAANCTTLSPGERAGVRASVIKQIFVALTLILTALPASSQSTVEQWGMHEVTLKGPMGDMTKVRARKPENIKKLRVGDTIVINYVESTVITLTNWYE